MITLIRNILIAVLAIGIVGTSFWGYKEHQDKNAVLIQAENTYQRAFHELSYHMDLLHDKIGVALAMNSKESISPQMIEIWRITSDSLANVGQLPLTLLPFNKTEEFLSNIGDFTYRTAVRDLDEDPLTEEETNSLKDLYEQSSEIKDELRQVQHVVLKDNLRWMDVQLALATQDEQMDNTIIDGFQTVEKKVEGYSETNFDASHIGNTQSDHEFKHLSGKKFDKNKIVKQGKKFFNIKNEDEITVAKNGEGADVPFYSLSYEDGNKNGYMDITEKGGHPLTLLVSRPLNDKEHSLNEGLEKASTYLKEFGYEDMEAYQSSEYEHIGVYSFLHMQDDVRIYTDSIEVKVALDNLDILGLNARNYLMNHKERDIPEPKITEEEALEKLNPNIEIQDKFLAVIDNDIGDEVLTYEFFGTLDGETYRIFINAMDGKEEKVEKLSGTEINYDEV